MREDSKKTRVVSIRLAEPVYNVLDRLARADRRKLASFIGLILEDYVAEQERGAGKGKPGHGQRK